MTANEDVLCLQEDDVKKLLVCYSYLGTKNLESQMEQYMYKRKNDGSYIINLSKTWEKLMLAARAIVAIENPADVCAISSRSVGQRAVLKYCKYTGATPIAGRFTPGTFTNQIQAAFREPRLLIITDPRADHQPVREASYVNIPVIAFCNSDAALRYVDIAIPCNTNGAKSVGLMWWLLAREVQRMRGVISREMPWDIMVDLFLYRDPEEEQKEEATITAAPVIPGQPAATVEPFATGGATEFGDWGAEAALTTIPQTTGFAAQPAVTDWGDMPAAATQPPPASGMTVMGYGAPVGAPRTDQWSAAEPPSPAQQPAPPAADDWTTKAPDAGEWGGAGGSSWA